MSARMTRAVEVCVIGAGAAGLWAAARAARLGRSVLLLEKTARTGTKVLASGGTHCNLTTTLGASAAGELFGPEGARFLRPALRALTPEGLRAHFEALGVPTVEAPLEKIFPKSGRARDVRDALEREATTAGVRIAREVRVAGLARSGDDWVVRAEGAVEFRASRVIVCPGGMSYPRTGTTGDGYAWLAELGLPIVEPVPALVPLSSSAAWVRELAGVSLQNASVRLVDERGTTCAERARPLLFTHHGVSGPAAMDVSAPVARAEASARRRGTSLPKFVLLVDLMPEISREVLRDALIAGAGARGAPSIARVLPGPIPARVADAAARQAGLAGVDARAQTLDKSTRHALVEALKGLRIPIDGTLGFDEAEVTAGGLALTHVDPGTMRVRGHEGLYACGEILDLDGPIGGLNFQAAFATAELAARAASS
jgi:predicted Rossmann fold flavoprotein